MKDFIYKPANFSKIEFWAATTVFVFLVLFHISDALSIHRALGWASPEGAKSPFDYYFVSKLIRYTTLYVSFLILNFKVVPKLVRKEALLLNISLTLIVFVLI